MIDAFAVRCAGYSHVIAGMPCQDMSIAWSDGVSGICAVADGHGSPIHMRSKTGAEFAVDIAEVILRHSLDQDPGRIIRYAPSKLLHEWRKACRDHWRMHPLSFKEREIAGDSGFDIAWYGTTLICAAMTPAWALIIRIGDGEALAVRHDGRVVRPVPGDGLCGGVTKSLCDPRAISEFRWSYVKRPDSLGIRAIFLCTDGVSNSYSPESLDAFGKAVTDSIGSDRGYGKFQLADWLPELSRRGSADDMAIAGLVSERRFLIQSHGFVPAISPCNIASK